MRRHGVPPAASSSDRAQHVSPTCGKTMVGSGTRGPSFALRRPVDGVEQRVASPRARARPPRPATAQRVLAKGGVSASDFGSRCRDADSSSAGRIAGAVEQQAGTDLLTSFARHLPRTHPSDAIRWKSEIGWCDLRMTPLGQSVKPSATTQRVIFYGSIMCALVAGYLYATSMPGRSQRGELPPASPLMQSTAVELKGHVDVLSVVIGERRIGAGDSLARARDYVVSELEKITVAGNGVLAVEQLDSDGSNAENVVFDLPGQTRDIVLVGAHYDSAFGTPGANDNASGVAVGLSLAKTLHGERYRNTVRFVFFANEEPPYFQNPGMGALAHARGCAERREHVLAMLALESLGYYSEEPESQRYPWPVGLFYPDRGTFVGFVGNLGSRWLVREAIGLFRVSAKFPSEGAVLPGWVPGVGWSDHWAFWQFGYPAIMVTDMAVYRDPNYHQSSDVASNLSYDHMARVTLGLQKVVVSLAGR
jgi:hypothetical protein